MARPHTIPDSLLTPIMKMKHEGSNAKTIADWLRAEHNITVTDRVVQDRLQPIRRLQAEAERNAIREAAAQNGIDCVDMIDRNIMLLNEEAIKLLNSKDIASKMAGKALADSALKYIDKKMNLSGMDKPDMADATKEMLETLLKKIGE